MATEQEILIAKVISMGDDVTTRASRLLELTIEHGRVNELTRHIEQMCDDRSDWQAPVIGRLAAVGLMKLFLDRHERNKLEESS